MRTRLLIVLLACAHAQAIGPASGPEPDVRLAEVVRSGTGTRVLAFPADYPIGTISVCDRSVERRIKDFHCHIDNLEWESLGLAQGQVQLPPGKRVRLKLCLYTRATYMPETLEVLKVLQTDDLYELIGADYPSLPCISHLSGLEVLYLDKGLSVNSLKHLSGLTSLRRLSLPDGLSDAGLAQVVQACPNLRALYFHDNWVSNQGLQVLSQLKSLEELDLCGKRITDEGLRVLESLGALTYLRIIGAFTDQAAAYIARVPTLKTVNIHFESDKGTLLTDEGLRRLSQSRSLEAVSMYWMNRITGQGLAYLKAMPQLKKLCVTRAKLTDNDLTHLEAMTGLEHLDLPHLGITDSGLSHLGSLKGMRSLSVGCWTSSPLSDKGLEHLRGLADLEELSICGTGITDDGLSEIGRFGKLRHLSIGACSDNVSSKGIAELAHLASLEHLYLHHHVPLQLRDISILGRIERLTNLSVSGVRQDGSVLDLSRLKELRDLTITMHGDNGKKDVLQDQDLECLKGLTKLERLQLPSYGIGDKGLGYLVGLRNLNYLNVGGSPGLTDDGLRHLMGMRSLERLIIRDCRITDQGLAHLHGLKCLGNVEISSETAVSNQAIARLKAALPLLGRVQIN